ncbi:DUF397 domain-containing protein [Fodinicola acaciae]|uniref:DUF397 domain-containing protein n=1 Tax=Fodinicola acaciae TaxID=2681555 RepID=UPI0013D480AA
MSSSWRKSTRSGNNGGECVEVATKATRTFVRDTKLGETSPVLGFSSDAWKRFLGTIK